MCTCKFDGDPPAKYLCNSNTRKRWRGPSSCSLPRPPTSCARLLVSTFHSVTPTLTYISKLVSLAAAHRSTLSLLTLLRPSSPFSAIPPPPTSPRRRRRLPRPPPSSPSKLHLAHLRARRQRPPPRRHKPYPAIALPHRPAAAKSLSTCCSHLLQPPIVSLSRFTCGLSHRARRACSLSCLLLTPSA